MKLTILLLFFLSFCSLSLFAQSGYSVKGNIVDTASSATLANASISVLNAKDSILRSYTRAGADGSFAINKLSKGNFILLVTYPGYADYVEQFTLDSAKNTHDFGKLNLILKERLLKDVIIKGTRTAIKIKGDTTEFNAKAYVIQPNDKVEDLLKQLPGIQVDKDGKITAQGETVSKVLVDGEEFFGDDPTLVTKNIRADMVDKVQLYDKKSDQAAFTGIDDGVKTKTINIKLKEDKKTGVFGKATAGIGTDGYYEGQALYNKFKARMKFSAYATVANDGKTGLGFDDSSKLGTTGNNVQIGDDGGISIYFSSSDDLDSFDGTFNGKGFPFARTGGLHFDTKLDGDKASLNTNYKIGAIQVNGITTTATQQTLPSAVFNNSSSQTFNNYAFRQKLDATYQLKIDTSANLKLSADANIKTFTVDNDYLATSNRNDTLVNKSNRQINNSGTQKVFNASMLYTKKFKKPRRTISWNVSEAYNQNDTKGFLVSEIDFYDKFGVQDSVQKINQYKTVSAISSVLNSNIAYSEPISKSMSVLFNYGLGINNSNTDRKSFDQSAPGVYNVLDNTFSNSYQFNQVTNQLGAIFTYKKSKITFNFGAKASDVNFKQTDEISGNIFKRDFINWLPQSNFQYKISQQQALQFNYTGSNIQPTIDQIQPVKVNTDPLNITLGNPNLKASFLNRFNLYYNSYKALSGQQFYISTNYSFTSDPIVNNTQTDNATDKTTIQYVNLSGKTPFNYGVYTSMGRKISPFDINVNLNASTNGSISYSYINGALNMSQTRTYSPSLSISKYAQKKYDFYFGGGPTYTVNEFSLQPQFNNNAPGFTAYSYDDVYLPGKFQVSLNARYIYTGKTQALDANERTIVNATLNKSFFKDDNLKLILSVNNLFNEDLNFNRTISGNSIIQTSSTSIKRYFMLSVSWDFTKFGTTTSEKK